MFYFLNYTNYSTTGACGTTIVKLSKGTEEFINRLKTSFMSENVDMSMADTFPWENHWELGKTNPKLFVLCSLCHPISNGLEK